MSEVKAKQYTFGRMTKDPLKARTPDGFYYHAHNIRFVASTNEINGGFHFEKGNNILLQIPRPQLNYGMKAITYKVNTYDADGNNTGAIDKSVIYDVEFESTEPYGLPRNQIERMYYTGTPQTYYVSQKQQVLGYVITTKGVVLISTDNGRFDCIWLVKIQDDSFDIELLYMRSMGLSTEHPVEIINNYENEKVDKIYWVDTIHQLRHLNLEQKISNGDYNNLIDMDVDLIEAVSSVDLSQPKIININYGGTHTAGMIQYAYILYKLNGSQTMLSPISELIPLGKGENEGGGDVNEVVGTSPTVRIENIDIKYDNILVYGIKYTSYNSVPSVTVIEDRPIPDNGVIELYDNGSVIANSSIDEIKLLNNSLNFPGTIASKDNSLFHANYKENNFEVKLDVRAYQFPSNLSQSARVYDDIYEDTQGNIVGDIRDITSSGLNSYTNDPEDDFDSINLDYDYYKYQGNRTTLGGEGKYLKFQLRSDNTNDGTNRYLKDNEIYRMAIHFYNQFGQTTLPMWVCDFKAPQGNIEGRPNILQVTLKPEFYSWLDSQNLDIYSKPVGYKILIAERTNADKTILASGLINPMMITNTQSISGEYHETYDNGKRVRVIPDKYDELDQIFKVRTKNPNPAFRNAWLDPTKTDHEVLFNGGADPGTVSQLQVFATRKMMLNTLQTRLIDSPLQKASHYRNLNGTLIEGVDTVEPRFLAEFPSSAEKIARYWNYQDSKIMQLYCPEAIFSSIPVLPEECTLNVRYAYKNTENYNWMRIVDTNSGMTYVEWKVKNRLSTIINVDNSTVNEVVWYMPSDGQTYNNVIVDSASPNVLFAINTPTGVKVFPTGYVGFGVFSNQWADRHGAGESENFTKVQLFYRRYGHTREESVKGLSQYFPGSSALLLPISSTPSNNISSSIEGVMNAIQFTNDLIDEYPDLDHLIIKTTFTNIEHTPGAASNSIKLTSGINGGDEVDLLIDSEFTSYSFETVIQKQDLDNLPKILNGVTVKNDSNTVDLNGVVGYDVQYIINDSNNNHLLNQSSLSTSNYNVIPAGGGQGLGSVFNASDHILKPNQTGTGITSYQIYGRPVFTKRGSGSKDYNGDGYFKFNNTLRNVGSDDLGGKNNDVDKTTLGINAEGSSCITFVLNPETKNNNKNAISFEDLVENAKFKNNNFRTNVGTVYAEIVKSKKDIYLGGIYGGGSFEDKKRTNYLEIGEYSNIDNSSVIIDSPGDTYVQDFRFLRISRGSMSKLTPNYGEHEEILEYLTETTIDLMNRNDSSFNQWDSDFSYSDPVYHKYNRVYSQQNKLTLTRDLEYSFKPVNYFNATVRGSKKKISGELTDSWLQPLVNDAMDLDGKYGPINRLINFNDNIFTMQERGISLLSINPKVQITTVDAGALQLGTGQLLDSYNYITTTKGSLKWNCISTEVGIFFVDIFDKSINLLSDGITDLTIENGFKKYGIDNINYDDYKGDNPILKDGISLGYDNTRGDIYFTFAKDDNIFTLGYNIQQGGFSSFYDYNSSIYIPYKGEIYAINPSHQGELYKSFAGKYNYFYKENKPSVFEFIAAPEPLTEVTFNNLEYKDEATNMMDNSEVIHTFETIKVDNEFQDSGVIELRPKFNLRKLNRKWRLNIPRSSNKVNRIRNNWAKIRLQSNNINSYNHKIEDIILYYNPNYKTIK